MSQRSDECQLVSLSKTQQAGGILKFSEVSNISDVAFVKKTYGFIKVREFQQDAELKNTIGEMLFKAARLAGIKDEISYDVKADLMKTILSYFKDLSIEEIYKAFELERNCVYDTKTEHFQLFDSQYVSEILKKYKNWKIDQKKINNISAPKVIQEITESEKHKIRNEFLKTVYDDLVNYGFSSDAFQLFFDLELSGKIKPTVLEKKKLYQQEYQKYVPAQKEEIRIRGGYSAKTMLTDFQKLIDSKNPLVYVQNRCRSIMASEYLKRYTDDFETFKKEIE